MMRRMRPLTALLILCCLGLPGIAAADTNLIVAGAWLRLPPPGADAAEVYLTLANQGRAAVRLAGASSPLARSVTLARVDLPAGDRIEFKPGGRRILLQGLAHPLHTGDRVPLVLLFADGTHVSATALVVALNAG